MDFSLTPTSELEAVNSILATISEAPLNTLEGDLETDAAIARAKLWASSRRLQLRPWSFNYEVEYPLARNQDNKIAIPANALSVAFPGSPNYVARGRFIYDTDTRGYTFTQDLTANIVFFLPYDELPEHARNLIFLTAGKEFQDQQLGESVLHQFTEKDIAGANAVFMNTESRILGLNMRSAPGVQRIARFRTT